MKRRITAKEQYTTYASYPLVAGDVRAYELYLDLGSDVAGAEFKVTAIRADGKVIEDIGQVKNGIATYTMASNMYSVPGELVVRLAVLHDMSVLTDREIVFEVLEGVADADKGQNVVPLNDSVILRLGALEVKLSDKVGKEAGKGLSTNDFTDEHLEKLDSLDETIGKEVAELGKRITSAEENNLLINSEIENLKSSKADAMKTYSKSEAREMFVQKSDMVNVYTFKGSVNTFDDLPFKYSLIPNGVPTFNGEVCGTYDEETHTVTIDEYIEASYESRIVIPVVPITVKAGNAFCDWTYFGHAYICNDSGDIFTTQQCAHARGGEFVPLNEDTVITKVEIECDFNPGSTNNLGTVYKACNWYDEIEKAYIPNGAVDAGSVYNVQDTGINYAFTGFAWDSLGGEHKDLEAREEINQINAELNKKANKSDVVSAYRFCGSVDTFDDLPVQYQMIPNGVPTHNGQVCGTYDEKTHTVTIDETTLVDSFDRIIVPIVPINVKSGKYFCDDVNVSTSFGLSNAYIGTLCTYVCGAGGSTYETLTEGTIDHIELFTPHGYETVGGSTNNLGVLPTIIDSWIDEDGLVDGNIPTGAYDAGAVYEVKDSGLSYGWTGSSWDALGTSHIDSEARDNIATIQEQLQTNTNNLEGVMQTLDEERVKIGTLQEQTGDVETALDSIIEIQNSLKGGEEV